MLHIRGDRGRSTVMTPKIKASVLVAKNGFEKIRMMLLHEGLGLAGQRQDRRWDFFDRLIGFSACQHPPIMNNHNCINDPAQTVFL